MSEKKMVSKDEGLEVDEEYFQMGEYPPLAPLARPTDER